ncbi:Hypothetical protein EIN_471270, partial [Entamoeba invadens IP1]
RWSWLTIIICIFSNLKFFFVILTHKLKTVGVYN